MSGTNGEAEKPKKPSVIVLYNHIGEDWYEKLRELDESTLDFQPEYPVAETATVKEEHEEIARALRKQGYRARAINLQNDLRKLERVIRRSKPDIVFNLVEFFHDDAGLEAAVAALFDLYQLTYTGASPFALELCQRKGLAKMVLEDFRVPTPRFEIVYGKEIPKRLKLKYPLIVKPAWEDASSGVDEGSVVHHEEGLAARLARVYQEFEQPILIEEFIDGRELHVSVWGNDYPHILPPIEFDFSRLPDGHPHLISYEAKWDPLAEVYHRIHTICPARLTKRQLAKVEEVAIRAYEATECRDYARLDIRLRGNTPYVLEVNPNPDLTESVSFMESAEVAGYTFPEALREIVEMALARKARTTPTVPVVGDPPSPRMERLFGPFRDTRSAAPNEREAGERGAETEEEGGPQG